MIKEKKNQVFFDERMNLDYKRLLKYDCKKETKKTQRLIPALNFRKRKHYLFLPFDLDCLFDFCLSFAACERA